jgi:putative membrane protein
LKIFLTIIVLIFVMLIAMVLGAKNDQLVTVNYLISQAELRLSVLLVIMLLAGVGLSISIVSLYWIKLRWRIRKLERKQKSLTSSKSV